MRYNPMSTEEVRVKFGKLARPMMGRRQVEAVIEMVDRIEDVDDVSALMALMSV